MEEISIDERLRPLPIGTLVAYRFVFTPLSHSPAEIWIFTWSRLRWLKIPPGPALVTKITGQPWLPAVHGTGQSRLPASHGNKLATASGGPQILVGHGSQPVMMGPTIHMS